MKPTQGIRRLKTLFACALIAAASIALVSCNDDDEEDTEVDDEDELD